MTLRQPAVSLSPLIFALSLACSWQPDMQVVPNPPEDGTKDCALATPHLARTPEALALAADPAQCGQPKYRWLDRDFLGKLVAKGQSQVVPGVASTLALSVVKVEPRGPVHEVAVDQIRYVTQDRGQLTDASALIAYPTDYETPTRLDILLVLHGTAGFMDDCAPSRSSDTNSLVAALASLGYVVVAPDYLGLLGLVPQGSTGSPILHSYLVGQPTAIASLDAMRAAVKYLATTKTDVPVCAGLRFLTFGGSQGGHAALWVDRLAPYYAPEFLHMGVVATVPPADLLAEGVRALRMEVPASLNMAAFFGAASDWYGNAEKLSEVFNPPLDQQIPAALRSTCDPSGMLAGKSLTDVFQKSVLDAASLPDGVRNIMPWGCMAVENGLTTTSIARIPPRAPGYGILFLLGQSDTLVDPTTERASFDTLCNQGMQMQYLECAGASHTKATMWALPEIYDFLVDRFDGKPMDPSLVCKRSAATTCRATP